MPRVYGFTEFALLLQSNRLPRRGHLRPRRIYVSQQGEQQNQIPTLHCRGTRSVVQHSDSDSKQQRTKPHNEAAIKMPRWHLGQRGVKTVSLVLVNDLHSQLNFSRIVGSSDWAKVAGGEGIAHVLELGVVKGVETLCAQFQTAAALIKGKALEQSDVPILPARSVYRIARHIAKRSGARNCKRSWIEPSGNGMGC